MPKRRTNPSAITVDSFNDCAPEKDPDNSAESLFAEIDALAEDVRTKQSAYGIRSSRPHAATTTAAADSLSHLVTDGYDASIADDDTKKKLAMKASAAISRPGAFDGDGNPLPKPSQEILIQSARDRKEEKKRRQNMERDGPYSSLDDEGDPLDDLQLRMNDFINSTNKEDEEAQEERNKQQRRRRGRIVAWCVVGLIVTIAIIVVGVVMGTSGGSSGDDGAAGLSPTPVPTNSFDAALMECIVRTNETDQSERYYKVRDVVIFEYPDMALSIASVNGPARRSLCWLVYADALKVDVTRGDDYQVVQRFALGLIYFHFVDATDTNDLHESNWLTPVHECEWDFLVCYADASNKVERLELRRKRLSGSIPSELSLLTQLAHIKFGVNFLTGSIPLELWTMTQLEVLSLYSNRLTGTFPNEVINLTGLKQLDLGGSLIAGTMPDMSALIKLESFTIFDEGEVTGPFPNMSGWSDLEILHIGSTGITGSIPTYIGALTKLTNLRISTTSLIGTLPSELGTLLNIVDLKLEDGDFTGSIPSELGNLASLRTLSVFRTPSLSGTIPTELGRLSNMESFDVLGCWQLMGSIPAEVCTLRRTELLTTLRAECKRMSCDCCTKCGQG